MDLVKLLLLLLFRPQVALRLVHHRRTTVRPMSEMEEAGLLKEHASELEGDHHRPKERATQDEPAVNRGSLRVHGRSNFPGLG
jgi:hypothetical protein